MAEHQRQQQNLVKNYTFSSEEMRTLKECRSEAFFRRALPIGGALGAGIYMAVQNGYLTPNVKYGAIPKVVGGIFLGFFIGNFSYRSVCEEKIMRLPNSQLADILRQRYKREGMAGMNLNTYKSEFESETELDLSSNLENDVFDNPNSSFNLDSSYNSLLSIGTELHDDPSKATPKSNFDEIRKRNREAYEKREKDLLKNI